MKYFLFLLVIFIFIYDILKNKKNSIENFKQKENNINTDLENNNETDCKTDKIKLCKLNTSNSDNIHPHFFSWSNLNLEY